MKDYVLMKPDSYPYNPNHIYRLEIGGYGEALNFYFYWSRGSVEIDGSFIIKIYEVN